MKKIIQTSTLIIAIFGCWILLQTSCRKNLLDQPPTTELSPDVFWKTDADATAGLMDCMHRQDHAGIVIIILTDRENMLGHAVLAQLLVT
jgi:hypothetical protein